MMHPKLLTSLQHSLVKHLVKLRVDKTYRHENQTIVLEGIKAIQELASRAVRILYTDAYASLASQLPGEKWQITEAILRKISGLLSPEGMLAEIRMPSFVSLNQAKQVLAMDEISDPGNMGTLLRTALALGWETVYFLPGSCDPFNEKVLRAARGAHFQLTLSKGTAEQLHQWTKREKVQSLVADIQGEKLENIPASSRRLLVLGNEAHGASTLIKQFCHPVTIPMPGKMESLNVAIAGGILLYVLPKCKDFL